MEKNEMRKAYMDKLITHEDYYRSIYKDLHLSFHEVKSLPKTLDGWDGLAYSYIDENYARKVFADHGDHKSLSGMICALKQSARDTFKEKSK